MKLAICSPRLFGYRVFIETINSKGSLIEFYKEGFEKEIWLMNKFHIIISDEAGFELNRQRTEVEEVDEYLTTS